MVAQKFDAAHEHEAAVRILFARLTLPLPTAISSRLIAGIVFFVIGAVIVSVVVPVLMGGHGGTFAAFGALRFDRGKVSTEPARFTLCQTPGTHTT